MRLGPSVACVCGGKGGGDRGRGYEERRSSANIGLTHTRCSRNVNCYFENWRKFSLRGSIAFLRTRE